MLPNLLIIGAGKSGTTALHAYLALHPEIGMSERKELQFFTRTSWRDLVPWYSAQFQAAFPVRGEASPDYTMAPFLPCVADRIQELIPDAKLIYMVREPIERAIAHYVEYVALRLEDRPIRAALADPDDPSNPYICASRYASQLAPFVERFESSQLLVLDQLDLLHDRERTLQAVFRFVGVDPGFMAPGFRSSHNTADAKVRYGRLGTWLMKHQVLRAGRRRIPHDRKPLPRPLRALLATPIDTYLPQQAVSPLVQHLNPEVRRLRQMTGMRFADWRRFPAG